MGPASTGNAEHLRTDHLVQNLGHHAVSGGLVTAAAQGTKFVLNLGSAILLARLLSPQEFGVVAMALAAAGLLSLFKEAGLSLATVQSETITQGQVSSLFWINVALGAITSVIGIFLAPLIAWFYRDPRVTDVMIAVSFVALLTGMAVQHQALLIRQMRFRALAIIEVASMLAGIGAACCLAAFGFGYWSLVAQQLCAAAAGLALIWWASRWRPTIPDWRNGLAPLLTFGAHLTVSDLVGRLATSSDAILVGRFFGAEPLGLYSRASVLIARPLEQLLTPLSAVLIPVLSRLQSDPDRYRRTFLRAYDTLALITFPFGAVCLALAEPIVLVILGPNWAGVVPLFAGFSLVAMSLPLSIAASWLFTSQGRGRDLLHTYLLLSGVTVGAFLAGLAWGPLGVVLALAVASFVIRLPILYHLAGRRGPVRTVDLWKAFASHLPCWVAVYAATTLVHRSLGPAEPLVQLLVCAPVGLVAAAGLVLVLQRPRESALYTWNTLRGSLARPWGGAA